MAKGSNKTQKVQGGRDLARNGKRRTKNEPRNASTGKASQALNKASRRTTGNKRADVSRRATHTPATCAPRSNSKASKPESVVKGGTEEKFRGKKIAGMEIDRQGQRIGVATVLPGQRRDWKLKPLLQQIAQRNTTHMGRIDDLIKKHQPPPPLVNDKKTRKKLKLPKSIRNKKGFPQLPSKKKK